MILGKNSTGVWRVMENVTDNSSFALEAAI